MSRVKFVCPAPTSSTDAPSAYLTYFQDTGSLLTNAAAAVLPAEDRQPPRKALSTEESSRTSPAVTVTEITQKNVRPRQ
jgi:hypothetical protein